MRNSNHRAKAAGYTAHPSARGRFGARWKGLLLAAAVALTAAAQAPLPAAAAASPLPSVMLGYLNTYDVDSSMAYLNRTQGSVKTVAPYYFHFDSTGALVPQYISPSLISRVHTQGKRIIALVGNGWDRQAGIGALAQTDALTTQLAKYVRDYNFDGVNLDFENLTVDQRGALTAFVAAARAKIPAGKEVSVAVASNPTGNTTTGWAASYDYAALAKSADYLMIMAYDEHAGGGAAGPVASLPFVTKAVKYALSVAPADKIVLGVPFYGRVWSDSQYAGYGMVSPLIYQAIAMYRGAVKYDAARDSVVATFTIKAGDPTLTLGAGVMRPGNYTIWFDSPVSLQKKLALISQYKLRGMAAWAIGQENPVIWNSVPDWFGGAPGNARQGVVLPTGLNLRAAPNTAASIKLVLPQYAVVDILATPNGEWSEVRAPSGATGFVTTRYLYFVAAGPAVSASAIIRLGGTDRFGTAVAISQQTFRKADCVVIAAGMNFPDALAAVPFAVNRGAPILLSGASGLTGATLAEVKRLGAAKAYLLGGAAAVPEKTAAQLKNAGVTDIKRIAGADRYETATKIGSLLPKGGKAILVSGLNYPDGISAGPLAGMRQIPILFSATVSLPSATRAFIKDHGITEVTILGGVGVVSAGVENSLRSAGVKNITRIAGVDRYETSAKAAQTYAAMFGDNISVATGQTFPDALTGGVLASLKRAPVLLLNPAGTPSPIAKQVVAKIGSPSVYIFGGQGSLSDAAVHKLLPK